jgi:2-keto-4-pentenoate hydratase
MTREIELVTEALLRARRECTPCDASDCADAVRDATEAYAIQDLVRHRMGTVARGFPMFWKTGAPGPGGVRPHAALPEEGVWQSGAQAGSWPFNICLVEAEIAFRLGRDVSPAQAAQLPEGDGGSVVGAMTVAIELVDSRWRQGMSAPPLLKLADLQSHAALVLGEWIPFVDRDWAGQACTVQIGEGAVDVWRGTHAAGSPVRLLTPWLRHASREGHTVPAGTVVTTGTWCGMLPARAGERVRARFEGVGETLVQL